MDTTLKISTALVVVVIAALVAVFSSGLLSNSAEIPGTNTYGTGNVTVYYFYGEECPHCHVVMPVVVNLSKKYPNVEFHILEIWHNQKNYGIYSEMNAKMKNSYGGIPEAIVGNTLLFGERDIPNWLEAAIQDELKKKN
jgi:thiol-disulfide isomerase/thioredoxin